MKVETRRIREILETPSAPGRKTPKYQQIYSKVKQAILSGELPNSCELPPTRLLADALGVSRSTVIKVYDLLKLEGLLDATVGSCYKVVSPGAEATPTDEHTAPDRSYVSVSEGAKAFRQNLGLINAIDDPGIAFRPGIPPLDLFPITRWKKLSDEYWKFVRASELSYYAGAGVEVLRKTISNYLNLRRNVKCDYSRVFILSGSLQSLYLIGNLLLNPGDEVILENPTFPNAHSVFKSLRGKVTGANVDRDGIVTEGLRQRMTAGAKLIHLTPSHQYPLGVRMSDQRKQEVLALANEKGLYIIENDYENEINHPDRDGKPIFSLDRQDRTFYLGTFNRTLHPSIRVGFVIVPRHLVTNFHAMVIHSHRFVSPTGQVVLRGFIEKNFLHEHLKNVAREAQNRHDRFMEFLETHMSAQLQPIRSSSASLHITALLKNGVSDTKVVSALAEKGIVAHALSKCYISPEKKQGLIFGYSSVKPRHMTPIMNKMADILKKF